MGLGPPVCEKCLVICNFKQSYGWECPICNVNRGDYLNLFTCGYSEQWLEDNLRWWQFIKGLNSEPINPKPDRID